MPNSVGYMSSCPLCKSKRLKIIEKIRISDLKSLYEKQLSININNLVTDFQSIDYVHCSDCDLRLFSPQITGDESFYNNLQKHEWYYVDSKEEYIFAAQYIGDSARVLDIGSGKGAFAKCLDTNLFTGLEFSTEARLMAQKNGVHVLNESIQDHAINNAGVYDVVTSFQVLEHVSDIHDFLKAAIECLKPGGNLIIAVPSFDSFLKDVVNGVLNLPPHHVSHWSDQSLRSVARLWSIEVETIHHEYVASYHKKWQIETQYFQYVRSMLGIHHRLVDNSLISKALKRVANFLERKNFNLNLGSVSDVMRGHTVTVVFRKPLIG